MVGAREGRTAAVFEVVVVVGVGRIIFQVVIVEVVVSSESPSSEESSLWSHLLLSSVSYNQDVQLRNKE